MSIAGKKAKRKHTKRPGLVAAAKALGVSVSHLWRVTTGERISRSLLARYQSLNNPPPNENSHR